MKSISSFLIVGFVMFTALVTVNASSDDGRNGMDDRRGGIMTNSGMAGNNTNRDDMKERQKQARELAKQKRDDMKNRRSGSGMTQTGATLTTEQLTCVRTAVAKREAAVLSAFTTLSTATSSGYLARATALSTAWTLSGKAERKMAIDMAWKNWKNGMKTIRDTYKTSHKTALNTFRTEAQTCKVPEALADASNESSEIKIGDN